MQIFAGVPRAGGIKRQWGCRRRVFCYLGGYFSETLEIRTALLYGDKQSVVGLYNCLRNKWPTDLEWLFHVKLSFRASCFTDSVRLSKQPQKKNKDMPVHKQSETKMKAN